MQLGFSMLNVEALGRPYFGLVALVVGHGILCAPLFHNLFLLS